MLGITHQLRLYLVIILLFIFVEGCWASFLVHPLALTSTKSSNLHGSTRNITNYSSKLQNLLSIRSGMSTETITPTKSSSKSFKKVLIRNSLGIWGIIQVVAILANAIKRLFPLAIQPFIQKDLQPIHWLSYGLWCLYMAYAEGYKAFHLKFSPLVVRRAFSLTDNQSFINFALAGPYSMGLFAASRKRMIISWSVTAGVFALVNIVKKLPYPYRSIIDGGVVIGLSLGTLSIIVNSIFAAFGVLPRDTDDENDTINKST